MKSSRLTWKRWRKMNIEHKARLKAQIMKDMVRDEKDGDRLAYVRLPGTSKVAAVAFYE